jgi:FkbM family methyltransferase
MNLIYKIARMIRHIPVLEKANYLWDILRKPYYNLLNSGGRGVKIIVANRLAIRIPAEFTCADWEQYETEPATAVIDFLIKHPATIFLDIGCSKGFYSVLVLFASELAEVIAFDSDIASVKATERACRFAKGKRLSLINGFVSDKQTVGEGLNNAVSLTRKTLTDSSVTGDPSTTHYECIYNNNNCAIPYYSLDSLLFAEELAHRSILIKCDVEGAEFLVLKGAEKLLQKFSLQWIIEIHPAMSDYGSSKPDTQVSSFT